MENQVLKHITSEGEYHPASEHETQLLRDAFRVGRPINQAGPLRWYVEVIDYPIDDHGNTREAFRIKQGNYRL